ncbi:hypothetical protein V8B97DRAFT_1967331 [Scleroderma yunnanense]
MTGSNPGQSSNIHVISNNCVGAGKAYVQTSTSHDTGNTVYVSYGSGNFSEEEYTDTVSLSNDLTISQQSNQLASTVSMASLALVLPT